MRIGLGQVLAMLVMGLVSACATTQSGGPATPGAYEEVSDPLEPINRVTFRLNRVIEAVAIRPVSIAYKTVVPTPIRGLVRNFLKNLAAPVVFFNDMLQGKPDRGGDTLARFVINSTLGVGGLFDAASDFGIEAHDEDFGQTLATWGVANGPYIVLPVLGPSTLRDTFGRAGTVVMDPMFWILTDSDQSYLRFVQRGVEGIDLYAENMDAIDELKRTSIDYYTALRNTYIQDRADEIRDGAEVEPELPDYFDDVEDGDDPTAALLDSTVAARIVPPIKVDTGLTEGAGLNGAIRP